VEAEFHSQRSTPFFAAAQQENIYVDEIYQLMLGCIRMANKTEFASTRLSPDVLERVRRLAQRREWSLSKTLAKLVEWALEKENGRK
jgi:hypothetical protein